VEARTRGRLLTALLASAILAVLLAAAPAAAVGAQDVSYRPDALIKGGYTTSYKGLHIYNNTGAHQKAIGGTYLPPAGEVHRFSIAIDNDGALADHFKVHAAGSGQGWRVQYFDGPTNITAQVIAGTFKTPSVPSGRGYLIRAKLTTRAHPALIHRLVTISSAAQPAKVDVVKFTMLMTDSYCPPPGC
jgi:hypothetical protein